MFEGLSKQSFSRKDPGEAQSSNVQALRDQAKILQRIVFFIASKAESFDRQEVANPFFSAMAATGTYAGIGLALLVGAFFFVNLVPFPHQTTSAGATTESIVNSFQVRQLSLFGFNTPGIPAWTLTTSELILIFSAMSFGFGAFFTIKDHL